MRNFNPTPSEMPEVLASVEHAVDHVFQDRSLLLTALTHSSYASEQIPPVPWNERLEFLGDAVLEVIMSKRLFTHFPDLQEGALTRARALLVNEEATSGYARTLGLEDKLLLGKGENLTGGRKRDALLGDAFEALLGAVYLDGGLEVATAIVEKVLPELDETLKRLEERDNPKGLLQEYAQGKCHTSPVYTEIEGSGPVHSPHFVMEVRVGELTARGEGGSKKSAEIAAARAALEVLKSNPSENPDNSQEII
ncbi:MAG: ribonuclease III [Victivallales bacterium]|nr:ribonuclease III [Victivallales bacterium]